MDWICFLALGNGDNEFAYEVMRFMLWYLDFNRTTSSLCML